MTQIRELCYHKEWKTASFFDFGQIRHMNMKITPINQINPYPQINKRRESAGDRLLQARLNRLLAYNGSPTSKLGIRIKKQIKHIKNQINNNNK